MLNIPNRCPRLAVSRMMLSLLRAYLTARGGDKQLPLSEGIDTVLISLALGVGSFENKLMNITDISNYIEMPRATVQRKLAVMVERDQATQVGSRYRLSDRILASEIFFKTAKKIIAETQAKLGP